MRPTFRVRRLKGNPPRYTAHSVRDDGSEVSNPTLQGLLDGLRVQLKESWTRKEVTKELAYIQKKQDGKGIQLHHNIEFPDTGCRYWAMLVDCKRQWFHEAMKPEVSSHQHKKSADIPHGYVTHEFFAQDLIYVDEQTHIILSGFMAHYRKIFFCTTHGYGGCYRLRLHLEYIMDKNTKDDATKFVEVSVCKDMHLSHLFQVLCGTKLKRDFSLSGVTEVFPLVLQHVGGRPSNLMDSGMTEYCGQLGGSLRSFSLEWQHEVSEVGYFGLGITHRYGTAAGVGALRDTDWAPVFENYVRLLCSPFWVGGTGKGNAA